jgi:hypothetical protein
LMLAAFREKDKKVDDRATRIADLEKLLTWPIGLALSSLCSL